MAGIRRSVRVARLVLLSPGSDLNVFFQGRMNMTNLKSIAGGMAWMAMSALLMLATLEPVSLKPDGVSPSETAFAQADPGSAAL